MKRTISVCLLLAFLGGCASIPSERYGIDRLNLVGVDVMDPNALQACLATRERARISLRLGASAEPQCGTPPFDTTGPTLTFWRWPWTEWPVYDLVVLERDLQRIIRWYQARGYYEATVVDWSVDPAGAQRDDTVRESIDCDRDGVDGGCPVQITVEIAEGLPTRIVEISITGLDALPASIRDHLPNLPLRLGQRFDESWYEASKERLTAYLREAGYAGVAVVGRVKIVPGTHSARVSIAVSPGAPSRFGEVIVRGNGRLSPRTIRGALGIDADDPFRSSALREGQAAVFDLGAFSSVNVSHLPAGSDHRVTVIVEVVPAEPMRFQVGAGIQSGLTHLGAVDEQVEVPQWDVHMIGLWEHRNLFGGLMRFRFEDRPRVVFADSFPTPVEPRLGNIMTMELTRPAFLEPRVKLALSASWDVGPDPFQLFLRHQIDAGATVSRLFFGRHLRLSVGTTERLLVVPISGNNAQYGERPASSDLWYLEEAAHLDLRDDPVRTTSGLSLALQIQQAGLFLPSSWDYIKISPDLRLYAPLPWGMVLVGRFSIGALFLLDAEKGLDSTSRELGPTTERFRGGGGTSNRGFAPGELGDGHEGGVRSWLASAELRVPVTRDLYLTSFLDGGDVSGSQRFRFDHPQTAFGIGLRALTIIGPITLDFGWRIPTLQVLADTDLRAATSRPTIDLLLFEFPGAVNLTLGDSF